MRRIRTVSYTHLDVYKRQATNRRTLVIMVIAPGRDFLIMLVIKLPLIRSLFGSNARIKEGIPMVTALIKVN